MNEDIELDMRPLEQVIKALSGKLPVARVGVISKNSRLGEGSNATIGAKHEYGLDGMPVRSWLRVPLMDNLQKYLEKSGAFDKDVLAQVVKRGTIEPWITKLAITAQTVIIDGFDSGGFGKWKPSDMRNKKVKQTLVETQQLMKSVEWDVKK